MHVLRRGLASSTLRLPLRDDAHHEEFEDGVKEHVLTVRDAILLPSELTGTRHVRRIAWAIDGVYGNAVSNTRP